MLKKLGFTMVEILVVIAVIGLLAGLIVANLAGARERAEDTRKKADLQELKKALFLYHNDFNTYPATGNGLSFNACGVSGTSPCPVCPTATFAAGGPDGCQNVYSQYLRPSGNYFEFRYYPCGNGEDFRLKVNLSNRSDPDLAESQLSCPANGCTTYSPSDYVLCAI